MNTARSLSWDITVVGAGVVGREIAANHLQQRIAVTLADLSASALQASVNSLIGQFASQQHIVQSPIRDWGDGGKAIHLTPADANDSASAGTDAGANANATGDDADAIRIVIESIVERREPKQQLMRRLAADYPDDTILATNTSTIPLSDIFADVPHGNRCCGLHFFMPVRERPLVEVVRQSSTDAATLASAGRYARALGKESLEVADKPGFVVNRLLIPYMNESIHLLCSGASADQIERVATQFGMPMSPLELMDYIGMETNFHAGRALWQSYPRRIEPSPLTPAMIKAGLSGRSGGQGFYDYDQHTHRSPGLSDVSQRLVQQYTRHVDSWTDHQLSERLTMHMLIESALILLDAVIDDLSAIDRAMACGLRYEHPSGLTGYFDSLGPQHCLASLNSLAAVGRRYEAPPELITALADSAAHQASVSDALLMLQS